MIGYHGHHKKKGGKLHACVTPSSLPISMVIGPANEHESRRLIPVMDSIRVKTLQSNVRTGGDRRGSMRTRAMIRLLLDLSKS